jgi:hypothetical protein
MNDQLEQLLKFLLDSLKETKDFTIEQAPIVVKEYLHWYLAESVFWAVLWLVIGVVAAIAVGRFIDACSDATNEFDKPSASAVRAMKIGFRTLLACITTVFVATQVYDIIKVTVAPRVVLIDFVRDTISGRHHGE